MLICHSRYKILKIKKAYSILIILCFSILSKAQNDWEIISDSLAMVSRTKADEVLKHFDTIRASKILYALEDKYYYLIIQDTPCYREFFISFDSIGVISKVRPVVVQVKTWKQRKQQKQYRELLLQAEPIFDISKYHTGIITRITVAKIVEGKPSYFVMVDVDNKRYGEYSLSAISMPLPVNTSLWVYLVRRLSDEIALELETPQ